MDLSKLNHNTVVLTANNRLANFLRNQCDNAQQQADQSVWISPKILPLTTWAQSIWSQHCQQEHIILSTTQEQLVWENIIREANAGMLDYTATTQLAMQAWQQLQLWDIATEKLANQHSEAVTQYHQWCQSFQKSCKQNHWISQAQLPKQLVEFFNNNPTLLPPSIALAGFLELPPVWQQFFDHLPTHCELNLITTQTNPTNTIRVTLPDNDAEIIQMASWAKTIYDTNPSQRIACIIPDLQQQRATIERVFTQTFCEENLIPGHDQKPLPFNMSAGKALDQYPIIATALKLLKLATDGVNVSTAAQWLQSPYLAIHEQDLAASANLDSRLREYGAHTLPLNSVYKPLTAIIERYPQTTWLNRWRSFNDTIQSLPRLALPSEWAQQVCDLLDSIGWPGSRTLNSEDYQLCQRWLESLNTIKDLDAMCGDIDFASALRILTTLTQQIIFQPQQEKTDIIILGVLESIGLSFDHAWIMGLHDGTWPPAAKPNPFLPLQMQSQYKMPHADAQREYDFSVLCTEQLLQCAQQITVSSPQQQLDQHLRPSRLFEHINSVNYLECMPTQEKNKSYAHLLFQHKKLEQFEDEQAPKISSGEHVRGGSGILKQQSNCPFRAFALYRLHANSPADPELGINPLERGNLLHKVFERFWLQLQTQERLLALKQTELTHIIHNTVSSVIKEAQASDLYFVSDKIIQLEHRRLEQLLLEWLELERQRPNFTVVQRESGQHIKIGPLELNLQIDRIDQLDNGEQVIIDYKTGLTNVNDWFGDRPREPQLPLYCIAASQDGEHHFTAISFAQCRSGQMQFKGIRQEIYGERHITEGITPINQLKNIGMHEDWSSLKQHWHNTLERLAYEFEQGHAAVDPSTYTVCQTCDLHSLCRIWEEAT